MGAGAGNVSRPRRGRRRGLDECTAGLAVPAGVGRPGRGVGSLRPQKSERARRTQSLLPESHCVIGLQIVSERFRLAKAVQDHGVEIFNPPHPSAGLFRASWPSGSLGKVGCGVSVVKPSQPWEWIPLSHENGICSLAVCEALAALSSLSWYNPPVLALRLRVICLGLVSPSLRVLLGTYYANDKL